MRATSLVLTPRQLAEACAQWQLGCPFFGAWAVRTLKPLSALRYGELVALVRKELDDRTDYRAEMMP